MVAKSGSPRTSLSTLSIFFIAIVCFGRPHSNVLGEELFGGEVIHEIFARHETPIFIILLRQNLFQLLYDCLHKFFEKESHSFAFIVANSLAKLLVNLGGDSVEPGFDLVVGQLHLFAHFHSLFVLLLRSLDLNMQSVHFRVSRTNPLTFVGFFV